jgi:hypothetical protein
MVVWISALVAVGPTLSGEVLASPAAPVAPLQSAPYFRSCDGLLDAIQTEDVERFFLGQVQSPEQALKLLADYGVIYTKEFQEAMIITLEQRGLPLPAGFGAKLDDGRSKIMQKFALGALRIARLPEPDFKVFIGDLLSNLKKVVAAAKDPTDSTKLSSLVLSRFVEAITHIENHHVAPTLNLFVRATLLTTVRKYFESSSKNANFGINGGVFYSAVKGAGVGAWFSVFGWIFDLRHHQSFIDPDSLLAYELPLITSVLAGASISAGRRLWADRGPIGNSLRIRRLQPVNDMRSQLESQNEVLAIQGILDDYSQTLTDVAVSIDQVCNSENVCKFNPVQLAYLGHLDLLEVESLGKYIGFTLRSMGVGDSFAGIRQAAQELRQDPGNYRKQMAFRQIVLTAVENSEQVESQIRESLGKLVGKIQNLKTQLQMLREKTFNFPRQQYSPDLLNKNEIILGKLTTDLATITELQTNQELILSRIELLKPTLNGLKELALSTYRPPEDWKDAASNILLILDRTGSSGGPQ